MSEGQQRFSGEAKKSKMQVPAPGTYTEGVILETKAVEVGRADPEVDGEGSDSRTPYIKGIRLTIPGQPKLYINYFSLNVTPFTDGDDPPVAKVDGLNGLLLSLGHTTGDAAAIMNGFGIMNHTEVRKNKKTNEVTRKHVEYFDPIQVKDFLLSVDGKTLGGAVVKATPAKDGYEAGAQVKTFVYPGSDSK